MSDGTVPNLIDALDLLKSKRVTGDESLKSARNKALERFEKVGTPSGRDEYWRFISPDRFFCPLPNKSYNESSPYSLKKENEESCVNIFFVDGELDKAASDLIVSDDVEILDIRENNSVDGQWIGDLYGKLEEKSQQNRASGLAAFNTAGAANGVFIRLKSKRKRRVQINYIGKTPGSDSLVHNLVKLESGTHLTLIEKGAGSYRTNRLVEIDILKNSHLDHISFFENCNEAHILNQIFVRQLEKSTYKEFMLCMDNKFLRNEVYVSLEGKESEVSLAGATIGTKDNLQDDTVYVEHLYENCKSRQVFKKVLDDEAIGAFQGKIFVSPEAQKTDGYQISKGLLISKDSKFLVKPELEIYADDVVCSHGSTSGAIDQESLFYCTSRGIPKKEAERILILAFLDEAIQEVEDASICDEIRSFIAAKLELELD